jgi:hypothetical protein
VSKPPILERNLQKKILLALAKVPNLFCYKAQATSRRGIPDIVGCVNGVFFALELKRKGGKVAPIQRYTLDEITKAGGIGLVVDETNWEGTLHGIQEIATSEKKQDDQTIVHGPTLGQVQDSSITTGNM